MKRMMNAIIHHPEAITDDLLEMRMRSADVHKEVLDRVAAVATIRGEVPRRCRDRDVNEEPTGPAGHPRSVLVRQERRHPSDGRTWLSASKMRFRRSSSSTPSDCGHQGQTDQPELFAQVFTEFFRDGFVTRQTAERAGVSGRRQEISGLVQPPQPAAV